MRSFGDRLSRVETLVDEIHTAVVGDGSPSSSLRERVQASEEHIEQLQADVHGLKDWKPKVAQYGIQGVLAVVAGFVGLKSQGQP